MKHNHYFITTAVGALLAPGTYAACPVSPYLVDEAAATVVESDVGVSRSLTAQNTSDGRDSQNPIARLQPDKGVPKSRVSVPRTDESIPDNRVAAAKSAERRFESREPPPRHLAAVRSCDELERERSVAG